MDQIEPPSLGAIGTKYLDFLNVVDDVNNFYCECGTKSGEFESVQECVAYYGGPAIPPLLADCYAATLDQFDRAREHVDCQTDKYSALLDCLSNTGCDGDLTVCETQAAATECPDRGYEIEAAIAETCLGYSLPPAFECGDGTKILPWLECDFGADCPDGSDEYADCPGAYSCLDGAVISQQWLCDGLNDCAGGEDEANCMMEMEEMEEMP